MVENVSINSSIITVSLYQDSDDYSVFGCTFRKSDKKYGNLDRYPPGSIARINKENGVTFFLLAST